MSSFMKLVRTEARLFWRDPGVLALGLALPTLILIGIGAVPMLREPSEEFGGIRFIDYFAPSMVVMSVAVVGLTNMPTIMGTYRERGVLRRMRATPVHPATLLLAQLVVNLVAALVSALLVIAAGRIVYGVPLPQHPLGFALAFVLGIAALFSVGMLAAARARTARAASGIASVLFMTVMFFGGVYVPRIMLPDAVARVSEFVPPGVQTLLDSWNGTAPSAVQLLAMGAIAVVAGVLSARMFKWE